ncbi:MAG: aldo/keto reductase [Planctomycetes bacterium]|nr:aldo/keto reductase [Planctomycetota bacterium]
MEYRKLGRWGVKLSSIGLGSYLTYGFKVGEDAARECLRAAVDAGVNFIDTANAYARGAAEELLGKLLAEYRRESFVLGTKVWAPMDTGPNDRGLSRKHIFEQCHASLKRLRMDYIDLYQCHRPDPETPMEETIRALNDLCRQGKALYWGVSEWTAEQIAEANGIARSMGFQPMSSNQPRYNLFWRVPELSVFPLCEREGIGQVNFSPLAHGILTGKYEPGAPPPPGTRAADPDQNAVMMKLYWKDENLRKARQMADLAHGMGVKPSQLALAWCLRQPILTSAIMSGTKPDQIRENVKAAEIEIPDDVLKRLDEIFPPPEGPGGV